jgi:hypothetical protein
VQRIFLTNFLHSLSEFSRTPEFKRGRRADEASENLGRLRKKDKSLLLKDTLFFFLDHRRRT